jgi:hypothetical protein
VREFTLVLVAGMAGVLIAAVVLLGPALVGKHLPRVVAVIEPAGDSQAAVTRP